MSIFTVKDQISKGLFEFNFRVGEENVPPGYDWETITTYSNIIMTFETMNGYKNDLGAGLKNYSELGCVGVLGIKTEFKGRLTCILRYGSGPEDLPKVIISGYDQILANTKVSIWITGIESVSKFKQSTISIGVQLAYKSLGGVSAFYYGPRPYTTA